VEGEGADPCIMSLVLEVDKHTNCKQNTCNNNRHKKII